MKVVRAPNIALLVAGIVALVIAACGGETTPSAVPPTPDLFDPPTPTSPPTSTGLADVVAVAISGVPGNYSLSVTISSPDTGCRSYADWWEVVSTEGGLLTRRVLLHSHVDEQPFTRSGDPFEVRADAVLTVRAHMSEGGYGGTAMQGTVAEGFSSAVIPAGFASGLETQDPLPTNCAF
jgi:hypothetical protein